MRLMRTHDRSCERARESVSLRLDGELSELGAAPLNAHLKRCASCSAFAADVDVFTASVRSAPLEVLESPVSVRRPRRLAPLRVRQAAAATAAAAVIGAVQLAAAPASREGGVASSALQGFSATTYDDAVEMRALRRGEMQGHVVVLTRDLLLPGDV